MVTIDCIDAVELSSILRPNDSIVWGHACGEPTTLVEWLVGQAKSVAALSAFAATSFSGLLTVEAAQHIHFSSLGAMGALRPLAAAGLLDIIPCHMSQVGPMIEYGNIGCDIAFVQVSPPDPDGFYSYGLTSDFVHTAVSKARTVIAEVNEQVPFTMCSDKLHGSQIDFAVHVSRTPVQVQAAVISEVDVAIARIAAGYIDDGAVLQIGIGGVPDAVLRQLGGRRDLGIHSGMIGDALVDLVESGVVTNARKSIDTGVSITGTLIGTPKLYNFAGNNRNIGMRSSHYMYSCETLAKLPRFVTINSAVEVDVTGQVNAEQSGEQYLGGTGGQVDYVRAGSRSPGGRSIIALPSTARGGQVSRISSALSGPTTTARSEVDVIVTEYGAAELKCVPIRQRIPRLISIAHPRFREQLEREAHALVARGF